MAIAAQLATKNLIANLDYAGNVIDLSYPYKGENNIFLRSNQREVIYIDGQEVQPTLRNVKAVFDEKKENNQLAFLYEFTIWNGAVTFELKASVLPDCLQKQYTFKINDGIKRRFDIFVNTTPDFHGNQSRDTAAYHPDLPGIFHYEEDFYIGIFSDQKPEQFTCQDVADYGGRGSLPDKNLGLAKNVITIGKTTSCLNYRFELDAETERKLNIYLQCARDLDGLLAAAKAVKAPTKSDASDENADINWTLSTIPDEKLKKLINEYEVPAKYTDKLSTLLKVSTYMVNNSFTLAGGTFAAFDSSYFRTGGVEDYSYFWPRDGAFTVITDLSTKTELTPSDIGKYKNYFTYLTKCFGKNPYLYIRYRLNQSASMASQWHGWVNHDGEKVLPIQLDETALSIYAYAEYLKKSHTPIPAMHQRIRSIAEFLKSQVGADFIHLPCIDLWENHWGQFFSTQVAMVAAFKAISFIYENYPEENIEFAEKKSLSEFTRDMQKALQTKFLNDDGIFVRGFVQGEMGGVEFWDTPDASINWAWQLNVLPIDHPVLKESIYDAADKLRIKTTAGTAYARYTDDHYLHKPGYTGNPWYLATLWFAEYFMKTGSKKLATEAVIYTLEHMEPTGLLPEMANPDTGEALSIRPLVWSHVAFLNLLN